MRVGEVIDERFVLQSVAGAGGMGTVFRSEDLLENRRVAVKVLAQTQMTDAARFGREARVLSELSLAHPAIVRYIAHGVTPAGAPYLAMEWLEGEDLAARLARTEGDGRLSETDAVVMIRRVSAALAAAHRRDVIHRDIKPSNLFLVDGDPRQVKVLDFGLARSILPTQQLTRTGMVLGTAGYMAPEQVEGRRDLDVRVDIYALGCVLFECLTGQPAFVGNSAVAVLAKVLLHEAPRIREIDPELSADIDDIVARMLRKEREDRPADTEEVLSALDRLGDDSSPPSVAPSKPPEVLTGGEQQLLSLLLVSLEANGDAQGDAPTMLDEIPPVVRELAAPLEGRLLLLASGAVAVVARGRGDATAQAARAATCALAIQTALPESRVALGMGLAEVTGRWPAGPVVDRAAALLETAKVSSQPPFVHVDEVTAGLLEPRFEVRAEGGAHVLLRARLEPGGRRLLGRPTPFVGRGKERAFLESTFEECLEEPMAQAVLITGAAGVGKSRLGLEFVEHLRDLEATTVLTARGDPLSAGSAFSLASQLVRSGVGIHEGEDLERQRGQLGSHLARVVGGRELVRLSEFLGELIRVPAADEPSPQLRAAHNDASIMSEQLREAFVDWVGALCGQRPVVIVLEDLQWGDLPSVVYLEEVLRRHASAPLLILALARPEVSDIFPGLWANSSVQKMGLTPLRRRASVRLVRTALGDEVAEDTVDRLVAQAGGNVFYLEELIRHVAERGDRDLPGTVLAMAQSRLDRLDSEARRILRAGSIFGDLFWDGALTSLLGSTLTEGDLREWLGALVDWEVLELGKSGKFSEHREYVFRHGLLREAAYAMLTEKDRRLGHRLAAEWLEAAGEKDAMALAEHFERGGRPERAVPYLVKAARAEIEGLNLDAAQQMSERGLAAGAAGVDRGALLVIQARRRLWLDDYAGVGPIVEEAISLLEEGSASWLLSVGLLSLAGSFGGDPAALMKALKLLQGVRGTLQPFGPSARACSMLYVSLMHTGQRDLAGAIIERLEASGHEEGELVFEGWLRLTRTIRSLYGLELLGKAVDNIEVATRCFEETRDHQSWAVASFYRGWCQLETGALEASESTCLAVLERADQRGYRFTAGFATNFLGKSQVLQGRLDEGRETLRSCFSLSNAALASAAEVVDSLAMLLAGQHAEAEAAARALYQRLSGLPIIRAHSLAVLANAELAVGRAEEALDHAREGLLLRDNVGASPVFESYLRLAQIDALRALGDEESASAARREARERLQTQAASLADEELRTSYLQALAVNARIMGRES